MNKHLLLVLFFGCLLGQMMAQSYRGGTSKDPDYVKYEYEDVSPYRMHFDFEMPEIETEVVPIETPDYQSLETRFFTQGNNVYIDADARLAQFINLHKEINSRINKVEGFRIQIFAGTSRENAERAKSRFLGSYPGMPSYLYHIAPNYRVRVGDFMEKMKPKRYATRSGIPSPVHL